jgi:hypothetical protein
LDDAKARSELIETVVLIIDPPSTPPSSTSRDGTATGAINARIPEQ